MGKPLCAVVATGTTIEVAFVPTAVVHKWGCCLTMLACVARRVHRLVLAIADEDVNLPIHLGVENAVLLIIQARNIDAFDVTFVTSGERFEQIVKF